MLRLNYPENLCKNALQALLLMKKKLFSLLLFQAVVVQSLLAQTAEPDFMRSIGKIYVVVAVIVAMFVGIIGFLIYMDKKLTNLENQIKD